VLAISGLIIWQTVLNQESALVRALEIKPLVRLGRISYALYLIHIFIKLPKTGIAFEGMDLIVVANFAVAIVLSQISWWLIESPSLRPRDSVIVPWLEQTFGFKIMPGDVYYVTELPSEVQLFDVIAVPVAAFALAILATLYPARRAAAVAPASALRYD
jgi:hypothetical protein